MAIIPQMQFFSWKEVQPLGDLEHLQLVLDTIPDEPLMHRLESARGRGRNDYPIHAMWNCVLAGVVFNIRRSKVSGGNSTGTGNCAQRWA